MCCAVAILFAFGPRAAILVWWLIEPIRWGAAFDTFLWPFLGFLVLPWTTLMYVAVAPAGSTGSTTSGSRSPSCSTCSPGSAGTATGVGWSAPARRPAFQ